MPKTTAQGYYSLNGEGGAGRKSLQIEDSGPPS